MPAIGKISGLCADYSKPTLNGRPYDEIYERIMRGEDQRFNDMMKRGGIPCELGHPTDFDPNGCPRTETDPTKVAVILTEVKKSGPKQLTASGVITDTPNGRIFKALSEYYNFGLSSRGSYEVPDEGNFFSEGPDGWNQDSYIFKGYDLVLLPANSGSVISATEGFSSNHKIVKVARESIDVNLLAEASQVSEDQVNEALDKLFEVRQDSKASEDVPVEEVVDMVKDQIGQSNKDDVGQEPEDSKIEEGDEVEIGTTLITNGDEVEKIKADLQTALDQVNLLTSEREKDGIELSNRNAEIAQLQTEKQELQSELDERLAEAEELVEKFEALKDISSKLLESYRAAKELFDSKNDSEEAESLKEKELSEELEEVKKGKKSAEESFQREKDVNKVLRRELAAAKESLISSYSMSFGVSEQALRGTLGKNYPVSKIRPAAESLANQSIGYANLPVFSMPKKKGSSATESFLASDDIERELMAQINKNI